MAQPCRSKAVAPMSGQHVVDVSLIFGRGRPSKGQRYRPQAQVEHTVAPTGLVVVVLLGLCVADELNLAGVPAETFVDRANLRLNRLRIRETTPTAPLFKYGRRNTQTPDGG